MKTTRRNFLKIMAAGVVVATVPIPVLAQGVVAKPWPAGESRMVFFWFQVAEDHNKPGTRYAFPTIKRILTSAKVSNQEDMDALEQTEAFYKWAVSREAQLTAMADNEPIQGLKLRRLAT